MRVWFDRLGSLLMLSVACLGAQFCVAETNRTAATVDGVSAERLLPPDIVAWARVDNLGDAIDLIWTHPLADRVKGHPLYQEFVSDGGLGPMQAGVAVFEAGMQRSWQESIDTISDRGVTFVMNDSGGVAVLVQSSSEDALTQFRQLLLSVAGMSGGKNKPQRAEYRDTQAWAISEDLRLAQLGNTLLVTNQSQLGKDVIDRYLDKDGETITEVETFNEAQNLIAKQSAGRELRLAQGYLDLAAIRQLGVAKDVFNERVDNFLGELVLGGILANTRHTPFAIAQLSLATDGIGLQFATPHDRNWEPPREYYFGDGPIAEAPPLIELDDRLFALSTHRDLSQMWLRSGDLLSDRAVDELIKADTQLSTFFSGRDFGEDILGSLHNDIQVVGRQQDLSNTLPKPAIELPEFAIQFRMKSPEETQSDFRRVFQSFIGFLNVVGAMNGQPQFDQDIQSIETERGTAQVLMATYVPNRDEAASRSASIHYNFSPSLAFLGDRVLLASTAELATDLISEDISSSQQSSQDLSQPDGQANTQLAVDVGSVREILETNKDQLIANSMLEKGHAKEAAETEIGLLLELVSFFESAGVRLDIAPSQLSLSVNVAANNQGFGDD